MAGYDNIREHTFHSTEVAREMGAKGGVASGKTKRLRKTFRESLKTALSCPIPEGSPHHKRLKKMMEDFGIDGDPTVQDILVLGMIAKAAKDHNAAIFVRDTIGEKPKEIVVNEGDAPPIVIAPINSDWVDSERKKQEEATLEMKSESDKETREPPQPMPQDENAEQPPPPTRPVFYAPKR